MEVSSCHTVTQVESRSKVLVMELCTGGSLFTLLDDPANSYGLEEQDFLCVLKDLSTCPSG